jgi:hypothetical protein
VGRHNPRSHATNARSIGDRRAAVLLHDEAHAGSQARTPATPEWGEHLTAEP